jgi:hypothetical protein
MADARQGFGAGQTFSLEVDFRLVPDFQPIVTQRLVHRDARGRRRGWTGKAPGLVIRVAGRHIPSLDHA